MSPQTQQDRWFRVKEILASALELAPSDRAAYLTRTCGNDPSLRSEIEGLLVHSDDAEGFIEQPALAQGIELMERRDAAALIGRRIGPYRIVSLLGEGGVGAVFRAVREDDEFRGEFALKLLKRGMDSAGVLRRFRDERRILARLNHPNIARFFDGGIAPDGRPYCVMELLEGTPIDAYCRQHNLGIEERLRLFLTVCAAVEYSHRNLVIHRDLKPTNILVTEGMVPKLLDFGIAKLLDRDTSEKELTRQGERMLTPDYASPEQIRGEAITTSADIYSLGVLLYELLTERRPFHFADVSDAEMERIASTQEPARPSSVVTDDLRPRLAGDLDTIVLKAMHKSVERRYAGAEQLAEDIRRHMQGLPVHARPDTIRYRLSKFARRNRTPLAMAAVSVVAVFAGTSAAVYQTGVAKSKELEARKRFAEVRDLANGLLGELDSSLENLPGATAARALLARKVLHYLDGLAKDQVRDVALQRDLAAAYERLADIVGGAKASNLGNSSAALESYRKAITIWDVVAQEQPGGARLLRDRARARSKLSDVLALMGAHTEALEQERTALQLRLEWQRVAPDDRLAKRAVASSLQEIAGDLDRLGKFEEALANRERVLRILEEINASSSPDTSLRMAIALANKRLGRSLARLGRLEEGMARTLRAIEIERAEVAKNPVATGPRSALAFSLTDLGQVLMRKGEPRKALEPFTEALRIRTAVAEADRHDWRGASMLATARLHHGNALAASGNRGDGIEQIRKSLAARQDLADRNPKNAGARGEIAEAAAALADRLGRGPESRMLYERALSIYRELQSAGSLTAELAGEPARIELLLRK